MLKDYFVNNTTAIVNLESVLTVAHKRHTELLLFYNLFDKSESKDSTKILLSCILEELFNRLDHYVVKPLLFYKSGSILNNNHENVIKRICKAAGVVIVEYSENFDIFIDRKETDEVKILVSKKLNEKYVSPPRQLQTLKRLLVKNSLTYLHDSIFSNKTLKSNLLK
jgi:hypothetical protein